MNQYIQAHLQFDIALLFKKAATQLDMPAHELYEIAVNPPEETESMTDHDPYGYDQGERMGIFYLLHSLLKEMPMFDQHLLSIQLKRTP